MQLERVLIPRRVRGFDDGRPDAQAYDVRLDGDRVAAVSPADGPAQGMLLSALVDAHVHLDKNYTVGQVGAAQGDLFAAITRMAQARAHWSGPDLRARMTRALEDAWQSGTRAMRTHLDWNERDAPLSLGVFEALRDAWAGRIELQCVSLTPLDLFAGASAGEDIAREVARAGGVMGAFVYRNADLEPKLRRVFELARQNGLALDFHVDEGLHADANGLALIAELAVRMGMAGQVSCSHCCSLSVQPEAQAQATLAGCARAGLHLVALPTTNLYLQGAWDRTPVERGITRLREAAGHGLRGCIATDNVADGFYPYGSYDLLETFGLGVQVAHLAPATDWLDAITTSPARAMGLAWDGRIAPGCPADLVHLQARDEFELLGPTGRRRTVIRAGRPL
ncbi:MAG TPA: amidohydrolase family protein [Ramlibacter sp.]|jgi:cytosine deaminase|uniref:amidohydrolase family protein n=1 Tax=Ramlibacter sp. TaxID=1917967 RepID=UPI002D2F9818|nr:amidohydrolase family protein [Ramlibacter sp.]HZY16961.1 amidohydrolase family protein [Ramlibacter sp.]